MYWIGYFIYILVLWIASSIDSFKGIAVKDIDYFNCFCYIFTYIYLLFASPMS